MPEWLTHALLGLVVAEIFGIRKKSIVILGALLPDILVKLVLLRLFLPIPNIDYSILGSGHTPFVFLLFSILICPLFHYDYLKIIMWLNVGALSHFLADATLHHIFDGGVRLFYPLTTKMYTLSLIWPNDTYWLAIFLIFVYLGIIGFKKYLWPRLHHGTSAIN